MDFLSEMNDAISLGLEGFKSFIQKKISENEDFLEQFFWLQHDGSQSTVLNYLIKVHQEKKEGEELNDSGHDMTDLMDYVLELSKDKNIGEPLHQAIAQEKIQLAFHLLAVGPITVDKNNKLNVINLLEQAKLKAKIKNFDVNRRDTEGRTLTSLALNVKNKDLLIHILVNNPNIHSATSMTTGVRVMFQPIHQAVVLNFADGVRLLVHQGAQISNPLGIVKDTPLILAARLGKINAMEALLEFPLEKIMLEAENNNVLEDKKVGHTAMEELCDRIANNTEKDEAIRGVAMLLCRGAEPSTREEMRHLLSSNRIALLKAVHSYLEDKPSLVDAFVNRCHLTESTLHNIVYADHSWGSSIRHLFGKPSDAAFIIENLVTRKYDSPQVDQPNALPLSSTSAEQLSQETNPLKLYSEFVRRYTQAYDSQLFTNRWSTMRWMIAEGHCDWQRVVSYARNHPTSRTRIIYNDMFHPTKLHEDIGEVTLDSSLRPSTSQ